jgi:DNA-binding NarL/FixJ family response regulator
MGEVLIPVSLFAKAIARQRAESAEKQERKRLEAQFTGRELEILQMLARGLGTAAMSTRLGIAANTVEWHVGDREAGSPLQGPGSDRRGAWV